METYSDKHIEIKNKLFEIADVAHSVAEFKSMLKQNNINNVEECELANGKELLVFTAPSSGYDIVGCSVFFEKGYKTAVIHDMY